MRSFKLWLALGLTAATFAAHRAMPIATAREGDERFVPRPEVARMVSFGFEAVVGSDGRLYKPQLKVSVDRPHDTAIQDALAFWRFEPARRADAPLGARVPLEIVLRVY